MHAAGVECGAQPLDDCDSNSGAAEQAAGWGVGGWGLGVGVWGLGFGVRGLECGVVINIAQVLAIGNNQIQSLPQALKKLLQLEELLLETNCITAVPLMIPSLISLTDLRFDNNRLSSSNPVTRLCGLA